MKQKLIDFYLDWFNDFLTVEKLADYYGIEPSRAHRMIICGRFFHNQKTETSCKLS